MKFKEYVPPTGPVGFQMAHSMVIEVQDLLWKQLERLVMCMCMRLCVCLCGFSLSLSLSLRVHTHMPTPNHPPTHTHHLKYSPIPRDFKHCIIANELVNANGVQYSDATLNTLSHEQLVTIARNHLCGPQQKVGMLV